MVNSKDLCDTRFDQTPFANTFSVVTHYGRKIQVTASSPIGAALQLFERGYDRYDFKPHTEDFATVFGATVCKN